MVPNCPQVIRRHGLYWRFPGQTHMGEDLVLCQKHACQMTYIKSGSQPSSFFKWMLKGGDGVWPAEMEGEGRGEEARGEVEREEDEVARLIELLILFSCSRSGLAKPIPNSQQAGAQRGDNLGPFPSLFSSVILSFCLPPHFLSP